MSEFLEDLLKYAGWILAFTVLMLIQRFFFKK
mgnify:CR=1 FL=1